MEHALAGWCTAALALASLSCSATELTVARFEQGVVPVLVSVDSRGKVTRVQASQTLKPSMNRLLRKNLDEAIVAPALRNDRPVNSQVVMRMKLDLTPLTDGQYAAKFLPVESKPVPYGAWFWRLDGDRYALIDASDRAFPRLAPGSRDNLGPRQIGPMQSAPAMSSPAPAPSTAASAPTPRGS